MRPPLLLLLPFVALLAGCPPKPPDVGAQLPWGDASELRLTPLAPGKWFDTDVSAQSGRPILMVVIDQKVHWCLADGVGLDCNPQASVGIIRFVGEGRAILTYPDPRRSLVCLPQGDQR